MSRLRSLFLLLFGLQLGSCGVYTFSGASISPDVKTFSVQYFSNRAQLVQPLLSPAFTEKLKQRMLSLSGLKQIEREGDLQFEGYISDYRNTPTAIQGSQTAALNRLTISVQVKFTNTKDAKQNFETTFTRYADYDSKVAFESVEQDLIEEINRQLIDDIFNKSVSNW
jgi:outer membrane lipopolysaccharide assembly protein LptE/RlpB